MHLRELDCWEIWQHHVFLYVVFILLAVLDNGRFGCVSLEAIYVCVTESLNLMMSNTEKRDPQTKKIPQNNSIVPLLFSLSTNLKKTSGRSENETDSCREN